MARRRKWPTFQVRRSGQSRQERSADDQPLSDGYTQKSQPDSESKGAEPETASYSVRKQDSDDESRSQRVGAQFAVILVLLIVAVWAGFSYKPDDIPMEPFTSNVLALEVPRDISGGSSPNPLSTVFWIEAHGSEIPGYGQFPFLKMDTPAEDSTRVMLIAAYSRKLASGTSWKAQFDLPDGAELVQWRAFPGMSCRVVDSNAPAGMGRTKKVVLIEGALAPEWEGTAVLVSFDLSNLPGMNFTRSRTKAQIRYPTVVLTPFSPVVPSEGALPPESIPPVTVINQVLLENATNWDWSERPAAIGYTSGINMPITVESNLPDAETPSPMTNATSFIYQMFTSVPLTPPNISGVNPDAVERDSTDLFVAGILLGVAGGAVITCFQLFVIVWPTRPKAAFLDALRSVWNWWRRVDEL